MFVQEKKKQQEPKKILKEWLKMSETGDPFPAKRPHEAMFTTERIIACETRVILFIPQKNFTS